jgi:sporulation protein YlmC with PRC-barrel domain
MELIMTNSFKFLAASAVVAGMLGGPAFADSKTQVVGLVQVDPQVLTAGNRASKVVGASVVNEANETIGKVDDLIITPSEKVPFAVLSVGGFLGVGNKYVVVPYNSLRVQDNKLVLAGATKESLKSLPEFKYSS